ncbi:glycosyltransferase family 4 protein [Pseudomonas sp. B11D7D]|nr:glycosyltransferase family 4 protein [Pseudomonas sp. B11D7D]QNH04845.1 glycosyltransferase family 4 protein [Pseudomonas sp. B11D7D]
MTLLLLVVLLAVLAFVLTALLRRYALARSLMDVPNERSSHSIPTPRGGGVAIVLVYMLGLFVARESGLEVADDVFWALVGAGGGTALLGFLDDHGHIAARWRLLGHFAAAIWVLYWLGGLPPLTLLGSEWQLGWVGHVLAAFYLVWMLNLYNFMDGIDGIASCEAICVCLSAALLCLALGIDGGSLVLPLLLAAAVFGFLLWNFPSAKIFMGDAGSGFLGLVLGALSLQAGWVSPELLWGWLILLGVFIVDATYTLARRLLRGERLYEAHRSHAYQFASRRYRRHLPVTLAVVAINLLWLLPIAMLVVAGWVDGALGLLLAYGPLGVLAWRFRAGMPER